MPFTAGSPFNAFKGRSIPLLTASALSVSVYSAHVYLSPLLAEEATLVTPAGKKAKALPITASPFTPLGWGSNKYQTLYPDPSNSVVKKPSPLEQLGSTPLRDLVLAEKYGACVDARGDIWMWGAGYDPSGEIGRSLKGKVRAIPIVKSQELTAASEHRTTCTCSRKTSRTQSERETLRCLSVQGIPRQQSVQV